MITTIRLLKLICIFSLIVILEACSCHISDRIFLFNGSKLSSSIDSVYTSECGLGFKANNIHYEKNSPKINYYIDNDIQNAIYDSGDLSNLISNLFHEKYHFPKLVSVPKIYPCNKILIEVGETNEYHSNTKKITIDTSSANPLIVMHELLHAIQHQVNQHAGFYLAECDSNSPCISLDIMCSAAPGINLDMATRMKIMKELSPEFLASINKGKIYLPNPPVYSENTYTLCQITYNHTASVNDSYFFEEIDVYQDFLRSKFKDEYRYLKGINAVKVGIAEDFYILENMRQVKGKLYN